PPRRLPPPPRAGRPNPRPAPATPAPPPVEFDDDGADLILADPLGVGVRDVVPFRHGQAIGARPGWRHHPVVIPLRLHTSVHFSKAAAISATRTTASAPSNSPEGPASS